MITTLSFLDFLAQAPAAEPPPGAGIIQILPFLCIGVIFYFLMIRPQQKKAKEHAALISSLKTGDKVVTVGGIHGIIANVKEATVVVKVADNVKIEFSKTSVTNVSKRSSSEPETAAVA